MPNSEKWEIIEGHSNPDAVNDILARVSDAEHRLNSLRNYVDPITGTVDISIAAGLVLGASDSVDDIRDLLVKFL